MPRGNVATTHLVPKAPSAGLVGVRPDLETAWMLDPQLCLDAFVWFHFAGAMPEDFGILRCWR